MSLGLSKKGKILVWILLVVIFIANLLYSFVYKIEPAVDARAYDRIGWNFSQGIGYVEDANNSLTPEKDNAVGRVGPGFEFFLAGTYKVFGHNTHAVWLIHALIRVLATLLVVFIVLGLFKNHEHRETMALLSGLLFGLSPDLIVIQAMLLTETLGIFLIVLSIWLTLKVVERSSRWLILLTSLSFTLAIMTRPTTVFIFLIVVGVLLYRRLWLQALLMFMFPVLIMAPWAIRNYRIYDHLVLTSSTGGYDLWVGNNKDAIGGFDKTPEIKEARAELHIIELDRLGFQKYFGFIAEHPFKFAELQFRKTTMYFSLIRPTGFWTYLKDKPVDQIATLIVSGIWTGLLLFTGICGAVWSLMRRKDLQSRLFVVFAILQPLSVIPIIVESRYRYPLFPFLAVLGALFLTELYYNKNDSDRATLKRIALYTLLILLFVTSVDILYNREDIISRTNLLLG